MVWRSASYEAVNWKMQIWDSTIKKSGSASYEAVNWKINTILEYAITEGVSLVWGCELKGCLSVNSILFSGSASYEAVNWKFSLSFSLDSASGQPRMRLWIERATAWKSETMWVGQPRMRLWIERLTLTVYATGSLAVSLVWGCELKGNLLAPYQNQETVLFAIWSAVY